MTRRSRGLTLIELMVSVGIMSIIVVGAFQVFHEGIKLFRANQAATDAQSSAIRTLGVLNAELANGRPELIELYDTPPGIVFASSITSQGTAQFDEDNGAVYWQRIICYYYEANPADISKGKLVRKEVPIPDGVDNDPGRTGNAVESEVESFMSSLDTAYFAATSGAESRTLGHSVCGFEVVEFTGQVDDGAGTRDFLGGTSVARKTAYDIRLEAGDPNNNGPNSYYIRVDSRVTPRG